MRTKRAIACGEELTYSYLSTNDLTLSAKDRRAVLKTAWGFTCFCSRCVSETTYAVCGVESSLRCAKCKSVAYCDKAHQVQHWKVHKAQCVPCVNSNNNNNSEPVTVVCQDSSEYRSLRTTRVVRRGEVLLVDDSCEPYSQLRFAITVLQRRRYNTADESTERVLRSCHPISPEHVDVKLAFGVIMAMEHGLCATASESACANFRESLGSPLAHSYAKIRLNAFDSTQSRLTALYDVAGRINHSCQPNATWDVDEDTHTIRVHALQDLAQGDEITIAYAREFTVKYTPSLSARRQCICEHYFFTCQCVACSCN